MKAIVPAALFGAALILGAIAPAAAPAMDNMMAGGSMASFPMKAVPPSKESGMVTTKLVGGALQLTIMVKGEMLGAKQPSHVHAGACGSNGPIVIPLKDVVGGKSVTMIAMSKWTQVIKKPAYINIHKSATDLKTIVACGDVPEKGSM